MNQKNIPPAVLALLKHRWQPTQEGFSFFEMAWERDDRKTRPAWYHYRAGSDSETDSHAVFKHSEALLLTQVPEFERVALLRETGVAVNEHLEHALSDFCSQVYDAFDVLLERAERISAEQRTDTSS